MDANPAPMPVVEMLRDVAADWSLMLGSGSESKVDGFAITPDAAARLRTLADQLAAITPERVALMVMLIEDGHEASCAWREGAYLDSDVPAPLAECPNPVCAKVRAGVSALSAITETR